ncbi:MAG: hypothetical protein IJU76_14230 [Desulfovibrionaceae bacterium]|nr:hypothetical protein [Desulfovibrionaceae bacterium]
MAAFKLAQVMVNGERHVFRSTDIFDVATKKYVSEFISETNTSIANLEAAIANKAPVLKAADIAARDALNNVIDSQLCWVIDASADPTVTAGAALYLSSVSGQTVTWAKLTEVESLDLIVRWADIQDKPSSTVADIDDAVTKKHAHANASVLDAISTNALTGNLVFNNVELGSFTGVAVGASAAAATDYTAKMQLLVEEYDPEA